jgi:hypothetical protein
MAGRREQARVRMTPPPGVRLGIVSTAVLLDRVVQLRGFGKLGGIAARTRLNGFVKFVLGRRVQG